MGHDSRHEAPDPPPVHPEARAGSVPPAGPPHRVRFPVNIHTWHDISFLHWQVDPEVVAPLVPGGTTVLTYDGAAWVGVTPFTIGVRVPGIPTVPWLSRFPETNVRTYVAGPGGREGLCFLRMEVTRRWFVAALRTLGLPYVRHRMSVTKGVDRIAYHSVAPSDGEPSHHLVVRPGQPLRPLAGGPHERFLTARWGAFHVAAGQLLYTRVSHPPWPLYAADVESWEVSGLIRRAGLPVPEGPPVAHFSPGLTVHVDRPELVAHSGAGHRGEHPARRGDRPDGG